MRLLGAVNGPLDQFKCILEKMVEQPANPSKIDQIKTALKWKFTKSEINAALQQMERLKSLIAIALSSDAFKLSQAIHSEVVNMSTQLELVRTDSERLQSHANRDLYKKLARWLKLSDPSINYHAALKKRQPGTGSWLLQSQQFMAWMNSQLSLLWIHGNAGCGKTVLSATALQHIIGTISKSSNAATGYFYFDFSNNNKRQTQYALRSLMFQLALQLPDGLQDIEELCQTCYNGCQEPSDEQVLSLLHEMLVRPEPKYIVLDALDECKDPKELHTSIKHLVAVSQHRVRILVTSRRERDIEISLQPIANHIVNIKGSIIGPDIRLYVSERLNVDPKLKMWSPAVKDEITKTLTKKANGMFRWVYCQLESLGKCVKLSPLRRALASLPPTLDATYTRIIKEIESNEQLADAIKILRWLCFVDRPLLLSELVEVVAIENGEGGGFDPDERLRDSEDIMAICSSLISLDTVEDKARNKQQSSEDLETMPGSVNHGYIDIENEHNLRDNSVQRSHLTRVRLAHFSVRQYLLSDRCIVSSDFQPAGCHATISESCLKYLQYLINRTSLSNDIIGSHPLTSYAAKYWWRHVQYIYPAPSPGLTDLIWKFFETKSGLNAWVGLHNIEQSLHPRSLMSTVHEAATPLYYAAYIGLPDITKRILEQKVDVNTISGRYGSALQAASSFGHAQVAQILLDAGANIDIQEGCLGTALQAASACGHAKIIQILLDKGADVNVQGFVGGSALYLASSEGHAEAVQVLVNAGAKIDTQDGFHGSPLQAASARGYARVVQMLLNAKADSNLHEEGSRSVLQSAISNNHVKVVQMLLDAGADVNIQGGHHGTALYIAASAGRAEIVQLLLDAGADVNIRSGSHETAYRAASIYGHDQVAQMLADAGADTDMRGVYDDSDL